MDDTLRDAVRRYAEAHADPAGLARTPIPGLTAIRSTAPSGLDHAISRPLACLVLQGNKSVSMGARTFAFGAGDSLLITADVPTISQITRESVAEPYLSLVLDLDAAVIAELITGSWPAATGRWFAVSACHTAGRGAWRVPSRSFEPSSRSLSRSRGWRRRPG